jgi:hypothetical protein
VGVEFSISVSYSQIAVFWPSLEDPFNMWSDEDVGNGFSWRPGSVSFKTPEEVGEYLVQVVMSERPCPENSQISVPFKVPEDGLVEIGSISDTKVVELLPGDYILRFDVFKEAENVSSVRLTFQSAD